MPHYSFLCIANSKASLPALSNALAQFVRTLEINGGVCRGITDYGIRPLAFRMKAHLNYHYTARFINIGMQANPMLMQHLLARVLADDRFVRGFVTKLKTLHTHGSLDLDGQRTLDLLPSLQTKLQGMEIPPIFRTVDDNAVASNTTAADAKETTEENTVEGEGQAEEGLTDPDLTALRADLDFMIANALVDTNLLTIREVKKLHRHFDPVASAPPVVLQKLSNMMTTQREENLVSIERYERARKQSIENAQAARAQWRIDENQRAIFREKEFHMRLARKHAKKYLQKVMKKRFEAMPQERKDELILRKSEAIVKKWMTK
jgi:ribosomal protein S6